MTDELLDIVDENDEVIGQKYKSEIYNQKLDNFRVINAFLINSNQEVWIPRRSPNKKLFPLCLDASVGGHVMAGESYESAFERELHEELNIKLTQFPYTLLTKLTPCKNKVSAYMHVYVIYTDTTPPYNKADFVSASWYTMQDLQEKIKNGEQTKGDLPMLIDILRKYQ